MRVTAIVCAAILACGCGKKKEEGGGKSDPKGPTEPERPVKEPEDEGFTEEQLKKITALDVDGMTRVQEAQVMMDNAVLIYGRKEPNANGATGYVRVMVGRAQGLMKTPMTKADFEKVKAQLPATLMMPEVHLKNPQLVFDIEEVELEGKKAIGVYVFSFVEGASMHGLDLFYNDGKNHMMLSCYAMGGSGETAEAWKARYSKADMMEDGKQVFAAYIKEF